MKEVLAQLGHDPREKRTHAIEHKPQAPSRSEALTERRLNLLLGHRQEPSEERYQHPTRGGPKSGRSQLSATDVRAMDTLLKSALQMDNIGSGLMACQSE